jgi:hypothetical protein
MNIERERARASGRPAPNRRPTRAALPSTTTITLPSKCSSSLAHDDFPLRTNLLLAFTSLLHRHANIKKPPVMRTQSAASLCQTYPGHHDRYMRAQRAPLFPMQNTTISTRASVGRVARCAHPQRAEGVKGVKGWANDAVRPRPAVSYDLPVVHQHPQQIVLPFRSRFRSTPLRSHGCSCSWVPNRVRVSPIPSGSTQLAA